MEASYFHFFHMICHFFRANIIHIELAVPCLVDAFVNTFFKFQLIELHLKHEKLHLLFLRFDTF